MVEWFTKGLSDVFWHWSDILYSDVYYNVTIYVLSSSPKSYIISLKMGKQEIFTERAKTDIILTIFVSILSTIFISIV